MTIKSCATCGGLYATAPGELFAGTPCRCVCPSSNEPLGMTTETDALPESVRRFDCTNGGAQWCQGCYTMTECDDGDYVRSEDYDRLTARVQELERENGDLRSVAGQHDTLGQRYARKCEAELAALKARIAEAPMAQLIDQGRATQQWYVRATDGGLLALPPALSGKRVALVKVEE